MHPSLALRTHALGRRCWGRAGRSILRFHPLTTTTTTTNTTHDSEKEKETSLDNFINKFQQILSSPKDYRSKYPAKKSSKVKNSRKKDVKDPQSVSYQPFTHKSFSGGNICEDKLIRLTLKDREGGEDKLRDGEKKENKERLRVDELKERDAERKGKEGNNKERLKERCVEREEGEENRLKERDAEREDNKQLIKDERLKEYRQTDGGVNGIRKQRERKINKETETQRNEGRNLEKNTQEKGEIKKGKETENRAKTNMKNRKLNQQTQTKEEEEEEEEGEAVERGGRVLGEKERALLCRILEEVPQCQDRECLKECLRHNAVPGFGLLRRLCAGVSCTAAVGTVLAIRGLAHGLHPRLYLAHLALDYYWASSLCHAGDVEQSLAVLLHLHRHTHPHRHSHPHHTKKVCNITQLVLYRVLEEGEEKEVDKVVDFVDVIAAELGFLVPALSLWSAAFTSPLFRLQQVSNSLMERHPRLAKLVGRRVEGLVERAAWEGNQELLQRILHFSLCHNLSLHHQSVTSALLQLQCDEGDLRGAEETIKFAQKMEVRLTPAALHRFLALLSHHRRPAPLTLLALKYHPPPRPRPVSPPAPPKYRF